MLSSGLVKLILAYSFGRNHRAEKISELYLYSSTWVNLMILSQRRQVSREIHAM